MTAPIIIGPPKSPYNRPARELAGYSVTNVGDGDEVEAPVGPLVPWESVTVLTVPAGQGYHLFQQPAALTDYHDLDKFHIEATPYNAARIIVNVKRAGAAGARAILRYSTSGQLGTFIDAGADLAGASMVLACRIDSPGIRIGAAPLIPAALAQGGVYWEVVWDNGDGVITPVIGNVIVQFFRKTFQACTWTQVVGPTDWVQSGYTIVGDPQWAKTGNVGGFQSGCVAPSCLAHFNSFRFGTGAALNGDATRQFSLGDLGAANGQTLRLTGEMSWTYAHLACGWLANPNVRLTLQVQGVTYTNVPSGFPPYDTAWNQVQVILPADGSGISVGFGLYGDNGECSLSVNGGWRNFSIERLDGNPGEDCI